MNFGDQIDELGYIQGKAGLDIAGRFHGISFLACKSIVLMLLVCIVCITLIITLFFLEEESFYQSLCIELAFGTLFFIITPILAEYWDKLSTKFIVFTLAVAVISASIAAFTSGVWQSILLEISAGSLIILGLEYWLKTILNSISKKMQDLENRNPIIE